MIKFKKRLNSKSKIIMSSLFVTGFSPQIIEAGSEISDNFINNNRSGLLTADVQSGKTLTFLLAAVLCFLSGKIDNVYIISGNAEKALKDQIQKNIDNFIEPFRLYLDNCYRGNNDKIIQNERKVSDFLRKNIKIIWGTELKKNNIILERTLLIWEESHMAQSKGQLPDIFLRLIDIPVNGDNQQLEDIDCYILSVSATSFSEIIDIHTHKQTKFVTRLKTGNCYRGIQYFLDNGNIETFKNITDNVIIQVVNSAREQSFIIIRTTSIKKVCIQKYIEHSRPDIDIISFDQNSKKIEGSDDFNINMHLKNKPDRLTVIFINGMCRMGQNIVKTYLSVVMETSVTTKTDTLVQGLLGRCCGYDVPSNIKIYIPQTIYDSGELQKYLNMMDGQLIVPSKGQNIKRGKKTTTTSLILHDSKLIKISSEYITPRSISKDFNVIKQDLICAIHNGNALNFNDEEQKREIMVLIDSPDVKFVNHNLYLENKTYETIPRQIMNCEISKNQFKSNKAGCAYTTNSGNQINCWTIRETNSELGLHIGDIYITCKTRTPPVFDDGINSLILNLPKVTGKEVFGCIRRKNKT